MRYSEIIRESPTMVDEIRSVDFNENEFSMDSVIKKAGGEENFKEFGSYRDITVLAAGEADKGFGYIYIILERDNRKIGYGVLFHEKLGNTTLYQFTEIYINKEVQSYGYGYDLYKFLLLDKNMSLVSDATQTAGGKKIWQKLMNDTEVSVTGYTKIGIKKKKIDLNEIDPWERSDIFLIAKAKNKLTEMRTRKSEPPKPEMKHVLDAIQHAAIYGENWTPKDFKIKYLGYLSPDQIAEFDDFSSWVETESPEDLESFRQGKFNTDANQNMPPIIVITAPDEGHCRTQIGDGRGRVNWAVAHNANLHVYHMIYKDCSEDINESVENTMVDEIWNVEANDDDFGMDSVIRRVGGEENFKDFGSYRDITVKATTKRNRDIFIILKLKNKKIGYGVLYETKIGNIRGWHFNEVAITDKKYRGSGYGYDLYKFLLLEKKMTLISDTNQTSSGQNVWRKLMDEYPDIFVTGYIRNGNKKKEIDLDENDPWENPNIILVAKAG